MVPIILQRQLKPEVENLFKDFRLKNVKEQLVPISVYEQFLPARGNDSSVFPYIIIRIGEGDDQEETHPTCKIHFIAGVYDKDPNHQGYKDVANILQRLYQHLFRKRIFFNKYECQFPVRWALNEEDVYPYYFGGLETTWSTPKMIMSEEDLYE